MQQDFHSVEYSISLYPFMVYPIAGRSKNIGILVGNTEPEVPLRQIEVSVCHIQVLKKKCAENIFPNYLWLLKLKFVQELGAY